jgi:hypothetical protein
MVLSAVIINKVRLSKKMIYDKFHLNSHPLRHHSDTVERLQNHYTLKNRKIKYKHDYKQHNGRRKILYTKYNTIIYLQLLCLQSCL